MSNIKSLYKHVVLLDKPKGMSSRDACKVVKDKLGAKKSGDTGTLDDNSVGLLIVCLDEATKAMPLLNRLDKEYVTTIQLHKPVEAEKLREALKFFTGGVKQIPPVRSAVARRERVREVYSIEVLGIGKNDLTLKIRCEAGFYVRKFAHDLGQRLGCGAQMIALRRVAIDCIKDSECVRMEEVDKNKIMSIEELLRRIGTKKVFVRESGLKNAKHGIGLMSYHIEGMDKEVEAGDTVAVFFNKKVVAVGKAVKGYAEFLKNKKKSKAYQYVLPDRVFNF